MMLNSNQVLVLPAVSSDGIQAQQACMIGSNPLLLFNSGLPNQQLNSRKFVL